MKRRKGDAMDAAGLRTPAAPELNERKRLGKLAPGEPLPQYYIRRRALPCPKCRSIFRDYGQAVVTENTTAEIARLRCRVCDHRWFLPIKDV